MSNEPDMPGLFTPDEAPPVMRTTAIDGTSGNHRPESGGFAGFSHRQLLVMTLTLLILCWGMWVTKQLVQLHQRREVTVRMAAIVNDYVANESRLNLPNAQVVSDTQNFMAAMQAVLRKLGTHQTIIVSEAVVASPLEDITDQVRTALRETIKVPVAQSQRVPPQTLPQFPLQSPSRNSPQANSILPGLGSALPPGGQDADAL